MQEKAMQKAGKSGKKDAEHEVGNVTKSFRKTEQKASQEDIKNTTHDMTDVT